MVNIPEINSPDYYSSLDKQMREITLLKEDINNFKKQKTEFAGSVKLLPEYIPLQNLEFNKWLVSVLDNYWKHSKFNELENIKQDYKNILSGDPRDFFVIERDDFYLAKTLKIKPWNELNLGDPYLEKGSLSTLSWNKVRVLTNNSYYLLGFNYTNKHLRADLITQFYKKNYRSEFLTMLEDHKTKNLRLHVIDYMIENIFIKKNYSHFKVPSLSDHERAARKKNNFLDLSIEECQLDLNLDIGFNKEIMPNYSKECDMDTAPYLLLLYIQQDAIRFYLEWALRFLERQAKLKHFNFDLEYSLNTSSGSTQILIPKHCIPHSSIKELTKGINAEFLENYDRPGTLKEHPFFYFIDPKETKLSGKCFEHIDFDCVGLLFKYYQKEFNLFSKYFFSKDKVAEFENSLKKLTSKNDFELDRLPRYNETFNSLETDFFLHLLLIIQKKHKLPNNMDISNWNLSDKNINWDLIDTFIKKFPN